MYVTEYESLSSLLNRTSAFSDTPFGPRMLTPIDPKFENYSKNHINSTQISIRRMLYLCQRLLFQR